MPRATLKNSDILRDVSLVLLSATSQQTGIIDYFIGTPSSPKLVSCKSKGNFSILPF